MGGKFRGAREPGAPLIAPWASPSQPAWHSQLTSWADLRSMQAGIQVGNACWELYCLEHG